MSNVDITKEEIDTMSFRRLEENVMWEIQFSHDDENPYKDIHANNVRLLVKELYNRYKIY